MTKDDILNIINQNITSATEKESITPTIHGGVLENVVNFLYDEIKDNNISLRDVSDIFQQTPDGYVLPDVDSNKTIIYFVTLAGTYHTADNSQQITINAGERAIIKYNGSYWEKIIIEELAQDITTNRKDKSVSQFLLKKLYDELKNADANISIQTQGEGNAVSDISYNNNVLTVTKTNIDNSEDVQWRTQTFYIEWKQYSGYFSRTLHTFSAEECRIIADPVIETHYLDLTGYILDAISTNQGSLYVVIGNTAPYTPMIDLATMRGETDIQKEEHQAVLQRCVGRTFKILIEVADNSGWIFPYLCVREKHEWNNEAGIVAYKLQSNNILYVYNSNNVNTYSINLEFMSIAKTPTEVYVKPYISSMQIIQYKDL